MKKIIFLDLEETIIDEWNKEYSAVNVNTEEVKAWIKTIQPDQINLFSYAMSNDDDINTYNRVFRKWIDFILDIVVTVDEATFTTEKLYNVVSLNGTVFENDLECMLVYGKDYGFQRWIELNDFMNCEIWFLDDVIETKSISYTKRNVVVNFLNVGDLLK